MFSDFVLCAKEKIKEVEIIPIYRTSEKLENFSGFCLAFLP
jgi:hypothetical protein